MITTSSPESPRSRSHMDDKSDYGDNSQSAGSKSHKMSGGMLSFMYEIIECSQITCMSWSSLCIIYRRELDKIQEQKFSYDGKLEKELARQKKLDDDLEVIQ